MNRWRRGLSTAVRLAVAMSLLAYLFHKLGWRSIAATLATGLSRWPWLLAAHLVMLVAILACVLRWRRILTTLAMPMPWRQLAAIFAIGQFFNTFMLGATGGDVVKAWYTARATHHRKTEAIATIALDRVAGMLALLLFVVAVILSRWRFLMAHRETRLFALTVLAASLGVLAAAAIFLRTPLVPWLLARPWPRRVAPRPLAFLERVYQVFRAWSEHPTLLAQTVALSLVLQFCSVVAGALCGHALKAGLPTLDYVTFLPLANLMGSIPATPGGIGIREAASVHLLGAVHVPPATALLLPFLPAFSIILWSLAGGIVFLFYRPHPHPPP